MGRSKLIGWNDLCMEIISDLSEDQILRAAKALKKGHLVAFPTETVYGLGADATNSEAIAKIYSVKNRPINHPLIVHISAVNKLDKWVEDIPDYALDLASEFWPGPMTLLLRRSSLAKDFITGGLDTVAVRIPQNSIALNFIQEFEKIGGSGIAAPSANRFRAISATDALAVLEELGEFCSQQDLILDAGQCSIGLESTIIDCTSVKPEILRLGGLLKSRIEKNLGFKVKDKSQLNNKKAPGSHRKHYSPRALVRINSIPKPFDGFIAMKSEPTPKGAVRLASPETLEEFGQTLYSSLRLGDRLDLKVIVVILPEESGIGEVIRDRLNRASYLIED